MTKKLTLQDRADLYARAFPKFPPLMVSGKWLYGMWILGNNYKGSGYYGAYPPAYLKRITTLFPDCPRVLHLFSGSLPDGDYVKLDVRDGNGDAENIPYGANSFDIIYADPPYSIEDAVHYGKPMINRKKVLAECRRILSPKGFLVWLDQVLPMYRKIEWELCGTIGMVRSTNHRVRTVFIFRKR